jgi:hypothetical protein
MSRTVVLVLGLGVVLLVAEPGAADGGILPPVPTVTVPPVPTVTLPPVPTVPPVVTVPAVPTVTVPPAGADVPARVPSVSLPDVGSSVPSVGQATPLGSGGRPAPDATTRGDGAAGPSRAAGRAGAQPSSGRGSAGRAASGARAGTARAVGGRAAGGRSRGRAGARAARSRSPEVRRRERRLRRAVVRYRGCLDGLPALERRVLVLRSGVGSRRARTRARVGRALDLSAQRVGRIERRGLRRLRGLGDGGCGGGGAAPSAGAPVEFPADGFGRAALAAMTFGGGELAMAAAPEEDRVEVKGERESSPDREAAPNLAPPAAAEPPGAVVTRRGGGTDLTVPLLGLVLLLGVAFATRYAPRSPRP